MRAIQLLLDTIAISKPVLRKQWQIYIKSSLIWNNFKSNRKQKRLKQNCDLVFAPADYDFVFDILACPLCCIYTVCVKQIALLFAAIALTADGDSPKVLKGSWSFDYETSAQRPLNVGTHLMGTPHNIHATSAHNEHLAHRWRTQRPHNVHTTSTQRWHNVRAQSAHRLATNRHLQSVH